MLNPSQVITLRKGVVAADTRLGGLHLHRLPLSREFALDQASLVEAEAGSTGNFSPPERVFGSPEDPSCLSGTNGGRVQVGPREIHRVDVGRVIGWQTVLDENGRIAGANFRRGDDFERLAVHNLWNHEGFLLTDDEAIFAGRESPLFYDRTALFIPYVEPGNYGAFLIRCLPLLLFLRATQLPAFDLYILPERTAPVLEAMRLMGLPERPIYSVREVSGDIFRTIHVVQGEPPEGFFDSLSADRLRDLAGPADETTRPDRLYVSRSLLGVSRPAARQLVNEPAVEAMMAARGFSIVHTEVHSFHEQMRMFAHARVVVGPSGSGMLNAIFARKRTAVVDMESFHYTVRQHAKVYASTGKHYVFAFGRYVGSPEVPGWQRAWELSLPLVDEAVTWALDDVGSLARSSVQ